MAKNSLPETPHGCEPFRIETEGNHWTIVVPAYESEPGPRSLLTLATGIGFGAVALGFGYTLYRTLPPAYVSNDWGELIGGVCCGGPIGLLMAAISLFCLSDFFFPFDPSEPETRLSLAPGSVEIEEADGTSHRYAIDEFGLDVAAEYRHVAISTDDRKTIKFGRSRSGSENRWLARTIRDFLESGRHRKS